jgi:4-hydroxy-tetrahydrodipicolinate synthase
LLSGSDDTALAYMLLGGHGVIRSLPMWRRERGRYVRRGAEGKLDQARAANAMLMPLHTKLFVEANPIPVKWALAEMG